MADLTELHIYLAVVPKTPDRPGKVAAQVRIFDGDEAVDLFERASTDTTNGNTFGLLCLIDVLKVVLAAKDETVMATVYINNSFIIDGLTKWMKGWKTNGWMTKSATPVKMKDEWLEAESLLQQCFATVSLLYGSAASTDPHELRMLEVVKTAATAVGAAVPGAPPPVDPAVAEKRRNAKAKADAIAQADANDREARKRAMKALAEEEANNKEAFAAQMNRVPWEGGSTPVRQPAAQGAW